jgi:O-antigen/teichoic acid export membrane protein
MICNVPAATPPRSPHGFSGLMRRLRFGRAAGWGLLLGRFAGVQLIVQIIGFGSGVLLIQVLSKADYALFTIANMMIGTMNMLADSGVSSGVTAIGGRVWNAPFRFGQLIQTALRLRHVFGLIVAVVLTPVFVWMLWKNGASVSQTVVIASIVLVNLYFQLGVGVIGVIPRMLLQTGRIQRIDFFCAIVRLLLIGIACVTLLNVSTALFAATAALVFQWYLLLRYTAGATDPNAPPDAEMRREIVGIVRRQAPNVIYYCVQGQVTIWLLSVFGSTRAIADIGALGRLAMIFTILSSIVASIIVPRFARCQGARLLWRRYNQILGVLAIFAALLIGAALLFPNEMLWVLGNKYRDLQTEFVFMILGTSLSSMLGTMSALNLARGWVVSPLLAIPIGTVTYALLCYFIDISTVKGVTVVGIGANIVGIIVNYWQAGRFVAATTPSV